MEMAFRWTNLLLSIFSSCQQIKEMLKVSSWMLSDVFLVEAFPRIDQRLRVFPIIPDLNSEENWSHARDLIGRPGRL
jgi:hypothetical protein